MKRSLLLIKNIIASWFYKSYRIDVLDWGDGTEYERRLFWQNLGRIKLKTPPSKGDDINLMATDGDWTFATIIKIDHSIDPYVNERSVALRVKIIE